MKPTNRRSFLKTAALLGTGLMVAPQLACSRPDSESSGTAGSPAETLPFGIQLWTLREAFPADPRGVLRMLSELGYRQIETFEGPQGMYWGMGHTEMQNYIQSLGMKLVAGHCNIMEDFERKAAEAAEIGMSYLVSPFIGRQGSIDDYKRYAEIFNERGEICRREGIRFAYHNHEYTFDETFDGELPQEVLMRDTDPTLVSFEIDIYWVVTGGADPLYWIENHPGRFTLCHVKDRADVAPDVLRASTVLGTGIIDFKSLLPAAKEHGMEYFFVEQEEYDGTTPTDAVRKNAAFMQSLDLFS